MTHWSRPALRLCWPMYMLLILLAASPNVSLLLACTCRPVYTLPGLSSPDVLSRPCQPVYMRPGPLAAFSRRLIASLHLAPAALAACCATCLLSLLFMDSASSPSVGCFLSRASKCSAPSLLPHIQGLYPIYFGEMSAQCCVQRLGSSLPGLASRKWPRLCRQAVYLASCQGLCPICRQAVYSALYQGFGLVSTTRLSPPHLCQQAVYSAWCLRTLPHLCWQSVYMALHQGFCLVSAGRMSTQPHVKDSASSLLAGCLLGPMSRALLRPYCQAV